MFGYPLLRCLSICSVRQFVNSYIIVSKVFGSIKDVNKCGNFYCVIFVIFGHIQFIQFFVIVWYHCLLFVDWVSYCYSHTTRTYRDNDEKYLIISLFLFEFSISIGS